MGERAIDGRRLRLTVRVEHFNDVSHFAPELAIESALREFNSPFTIIRPNYFFQNDATLAAHKQVSSPDFPRPTL